MVGEALQIPGIPEIAAVAYGPEDGRPVLALHGWLDNAGSFAGLAPLLHGLRLVALDLPGHGKSAHRSADASYHFIDWVPDVLRVADALGWARFSILGHSMGAGIATLVAGTVPERLERLALVEGLAPLTGDAQGAPERLAAHLAASSDKRRPLPVYASEAAALKARLAAGDFAVPDAMLAIVRRGLKVVPGGYTWAADPRLKLPSALRLSRPQVSAFLLRIACPVLVVRATRGLLANHPAAPIQVNDFLALLTQLTQVEVGGFHHVHVDDPGAVAANVQRFFDGS